MHKVIILTTHTPVQTFSNTDLITNNEKVDVLWGGMAKNSLTEKIKHLKYWRKAV
jgi:hypothetical protein